MSEVKMKAGQGVRILKDWLADMDWVFGIKGHVISYTLILRSVFEELSDRTVPETRSNHSCRTERIHFYMYYICIAKHYIRFFRFNMLCPCMTTLSDQS